MNKQGAVIIIEDDQDDQFIMNEVFDRLGYSNSVVMFDDGYKALDYLKTTKDSPFLILADINMPQLNGFELREIIFNDEHLKGRCIPYIFFTTDDSPNSVRRAYELSVQGYFVKPTSVADLQEKIRKIIEYWQDCQSPSDTHNNTL